MQSIVLRRVLSAVLLVLSTLAVYAAQERDTVTYYKIELRQEINPAAFKKIKAGLEEALAKDADYCIIDINTYGGAVDAADSIRTALLRFPIPVIAFINPQAVSAGALISIACDSIYMTGGSSLGAATVVNQNGEVMPDKYQSFMRAMMRATAESHGKKIVTENGVEKEVWRRDPQIAQAMVSKDSVLSFTPLEAIRQGYCEGQAENIEDVIRAVSKDKKYVVEQQKVTVLDKIIYFLMNPFLQGILLMLIIGGIYFELQSPGIGFPLVAAVTGAVLYFAPLYLEGLAQNWELLIFILGIGLLLLELFVIPGFGVAGISGIIFIVTGLAFAMIDNDIVFNGGDYNLRPLIKPFAMVLLSGTFAFFMSVYLASRLYGSRSFSHIVLHTSLTDKKGFVGVEKESLQHLSGMEGTVATDLKPQGTVEIEGSRYPAQLDYGYARKGERVVVFKIGGGRLFVRRLPR